MRLSGHLMFAEWNLHIKQVQFGIYDLLSNLKAAVNESVNIFREFSFREL